MDPLPPEFTQVFFRASVPSAGWPQKFAVVTAHNPDGQLVEPAANDAADEELRASIEKLGLKHFRVTGGSRDEKYREPGWGFSSATPQLAKKLSLSFRQLAFFWIENDRLLLVDSRTGESTDQAGWQDRWLGPEIVPLRLVFINSQQVPNPNNHDEESCLNQPRENQ